MKRSKLLIAALLSSVILSLGATSCSDDEDQSLSSIQDILNSDPNFSILRTAVNYIGLDLSSFSGNYTVFAPDNQAFLASGITENDIVALPVATVTDIINYHVVNGSISSSGIPISDAIPTLQGQKIFASRNSNGIFVNGVPVIGADIPASNGYIHVISSILLPPTETIAQILQNSPDFSVMNAAVTRGNMAGTFSGPGKYTLFVPDNTAFGSINETVINSYPAATVTSIVRSHATPTNIFLSDFMQGATTNSLQTGVSLLFTSAPESVKINGSAADPAYISSSDIIATNGVIHVIDRILE